ncbi:MAG: EamA family transporter [Geminicoccaceae bacterium]
MDPLVLSLVLAAALLHASWNALVKAGGDPFVRLAVVNAVGGLCAVPLLFLVGRPAPASWPYLFGSVVVHHAYYLALGYGYRFGDLSHVYPIARGIAPPLVALAAWAFAGESVGPLGLLAILVISGGIVSLAFTDDGRLVAIRPLAFGLATGITIAAYTLFDGLGGRASGDVFGYIAWLFVIDAVPFSVIVAFRYRRRLGPALAVCWRPAAFGGVLSVIAYGLVIWAMSLTPMASVSALRETSVIVAALIGTRLLREPFGTRRVFAASLVAAGVVLLQVSRAV